MMAVDLKSADRLYGWNRAILSIGGLWPLESAYVKFWAFYLYFAIRVFLTVADFVNVFGNTPLMIADLLEMSVQTMLLVKMMVFRHSSQLKEILSRVVDGTNEIHYRSDEEKRIYLSHIAIGKALFKAGGFSSFATCLVYPMLPLKDIIIAVLQNNTIPLNLPYRMHVFMEMDPSTYAALYLYQIPMFYFYHCHTITVCFLCTIIVHVTGEMSILAHRIRLIGSGSETANDLSNPKVAIGDVVRRHYEIIWIATRIDSVFKYVLMIELVIMTALIGLTAYTLIATAALSAAWYEVFFFINFSVALLVLILVYCLTGDFLIQGSEEIHNAFYESKWCDMNLKYQKDLVLCMLRAERPLELTAGGFYIFCLPRFSEILKTAMGYISILRTVV